MMQWLLHSGRKPRRQNKGLKWLSEAESLLCFTDQQRIARAGAAAAKHIRLHRFSMNSGHPGCPIATSDRDLK